MSVKGKIEKYLLKIFKELEGIISSLSQSVELSQEQLSLKLKAHSKIEIQQAGTHTIK